MEVYGLMVEIFSHDGFPIYDKKCDVIYTNQSSQEQIEYIYVGIRIYDSAVFFFDI